MVEGAQKSSALNNPWVQLVCGVICMAMVANLQYGWPAFVKPLDGKFSWGTPAIQVAFTIFVGLLSVIEEAAIGMGIHGKTFSQSIADLGGGTVKQMIATEFVVFLVFVPLFAFGALSEVMEENALTRAFFVKRTKFEAVS